MLDLSYIRNHKEEVVQRLARKQFEDDGLVGQIIELDEQRRQQQTKLDDIQSQINDLSSRIGQLFKEGKQDEANQIKEQTSNLKQESKEISTSLQETEQQLQDQLIKLPNLPNEHVPAGSSEDDNVLRTQHDVTISLPDQAQPHWELIKQHDIIDMDLGTKLTGTGFPVFKGQGAKLQRAMVSFFLDEAINAGYREITPPLLVNEYTAFGTGQLPDKEGQMYQTRHEPFYLIPTSEVPVTNLYRDTVLSENDFPIKLTSYTPCFRREAGSYGKDVKGLNRVHQFEKVEIVQIQHPDHSYNTLDEMIAHVEELLKKLELPYRIMNICGGDLGFAAAITYDFEVYSAAQDKWLEVSSVSNFEQFQSNRMKLRFKEQKQDGKKGKTRMAHTLNGSALALPRLMAALLENYQTESGIAIPGVLQPYTGFEGIG